MPATTFVRRPSLILVLLLLGVGLISPAHAEPRCFAETSQCIDGRFRQYWEQNGGLPVFGLPLTTEQPGQFTTQVFERNSFELHPENAAPYDVLLGRLGDIRLQQQGRDWFSFPKADAAAPHYFAATGHAIAHEPFWQYWRTHGLDLGDPGISERESLALFGLPLSEPAIETNASGDTVLTQWFERARFEDHGPKGVLLGLLGSETRAPLPPAPTPTPEPTPRPNLCQALPPASRSVVAPSCVAGGDIFTITGNGFKQGERIAFYGTAPDQRTIELPVLFGDATPAANGDYRLRVALSADAAPGIYAITLYGTVSNETAVGYVQIVPPDPSQPRATDYSKLPPDQNGSAFPQVAPRGTRISFTTSGLQPRELVGIYAIDPAGESFGARFQTIADAQGNAGDQVTLVSDLQSLVGVYTVVFEGIDSGRKAIIYVRLNQ